MLRRQFIQSLIGFAVVPQVAKWGRELAPGQQTLTEKNQPPKAITTTATRQPASSLKRKQTLIQQSPLAGFSYYQGETIWQQLNLGDQLTLKPEPQNRHDNRAVEIYWQHHKLGYLPKTDNCAISQMLSRGDKPVAKITSLNKTQNPWERIQLEVYL